MRAQGLSEKCYQWRYLRGDLSNIINNNKLEIWKKLVTYFDLVGIGINFPDKPKPQ